MYTTEAEVSAACRQIDAANQLALGVEDRHAIARGDAQAESDWDFLILLDGVVDDERTDRVRHRLYDIEWDSGEVCCSIVRSRQEWDSPLHQATPFAKRVQKQGIPI